jgi:methylglutaconyl-CoA hydratase
MDELVHYWVADGVATITLDSPQNRNALSVAVRTGLRQALDRAADDDAARVVLLDHTGPVFCAGMDLKESAQAAVGSEGVRELPGILQRIMRCPKPVVAKAAGPARAGGVGILAAADIAVTVSSATFAFSEVRIGLIPAVISVPVLARVLPVAAHELMLTGATFDAARAAGIGLVNAAVDASDLDAVVADYLRVLLGGGPGALAGTKALLRRDVDDSDARYSALLELSARQFASDEAREGARAFAEKRAPAWQT